jgi:hypothetical protein
MATLSVYDLSTRLFILLRPESGLDDIFPEGAPIREEVGHIYVPGRGPKQTVLIDAGRISSGQLVAVAARVAAASGFTREQVLECFGRAGGIELVMDKVQRVFAGPPPSKSVTRGRLGGKKRP